MFIFSSTYVTWHVSESMSVCLQIKISAPHNKFGLTPLARNGSSGRLYVLVVMFFLIRHRISELPLPIALKLCHEISICVNFIMQVQNSWLSPQKFGAKNLQNFGWFYTTSEYDREYLETDSRYPETERYLIENIIPPAFGEIRPVNFGRLSRK